jgi:hypothetical protein
MIEEHSARKNARASVDLIPRYRTPASFELVEGRCIDLSEGGMFIAAKLPCENGTLLKFECSLGDNDAAVKGVARVVWRRTADGDRPSGMGLKFVKLEAGSPELITQLVANAKEHGTTAPEAPLAAQVRVTESFVPTPSTVPAEPKAEPPAPLISAFPGALSEPAIASRAKSDPAPRAPLAPAPQVAGAAAAALAAPKTTVASSSGPAIWIALAAAGALLAWLLSR